MNRVRSPLTYASIASNLTLSDWLDSTSIEPCPHGPFSLNTLSEKKAADKGVVRTLAIMATDDICDLEYILRISNEAGPSKANQVISAKKPRTHRSRLSNLGEVIVGRVLIEFLGYAIPVKKLRYSITGDQSMPGTDVIAMRVSGNKLLELCFAESKARAAQTGFNVDAGVDAYEQLKTDYESGKNEMLQFILRRLFARDDSLFGPLLEYMLSTRGNEVIDRFVVGLVFEEGIWKNSILEKLGSAISLDLPETIAVVVKIEGLLDLVDQVFELFGVEAIPNE